MTEEMSDIVNEEDEVIGQEPRSKVHQTGLLHRGIHVWLFAPDRKVLIQRRTDDRPYAPGALDCSVSEHVQAGEDYLSAAHRLRIYGGLGNFPLNSWRSAPFRDPLRTTTPQ